MIHAGQKSRVALLIALLCQKWHATRVIHRQKVLAPDRIALQEEMIL